MLPDAVPDAAAAPDVADPAAAPTADPAAAPTVDPAAAPTVDPAAAPTVDPADVAAVAAQLGRPPRAVRAVAHRCPCTLPAVVQTAPRLDDGTPFPTLYYLTCARLAARLGGLEADGRMRMLTERLSTDPELAAAYRRAHETYLAERDAIEPLGTQVTAGGMPDRVKCLHVHVAHSLAAGPGVNPVGDETLAELGDWWTAGPCVPPPP